MGTSVNKCSLDNILSSVLSVAAKERNMAYPPGVYTDHFNTVTSFIISTLVKTFPLSQTSMDILDPFIKLTKIPVTSSYIQLPGDFRNLLGSPSVNVRPDNSECDQVITVDTESEFKALTLKMGCKSRPITIMDKSEFDYRTTSPYKAPDLENPIGYFMGDKRIFVCPYDIKTAYVLYARKEGLARYGYIMQPDDTFLFDPDTSVEGQFNSAAFEPLMKGVLALYSAYSRDQTLIQWSEILNKEGIL